MIKEYKSVRDCTELWVSEFNAIPAMMVSELMSHAPDEWEEVAHPAVGDRVFVCDAEPGEGELEKVGRERFLVHLDGGPSLWVPREDCEVFYDDVLPMWGTMWSFHDPCDIWWVEEGDGVEVLSRCGFRVFYHEEYGYFFGIDGAGYSFMDAHFEPLYQARGLHWHEI